MHKPSVAPSMARRAASRFVEGSESKRRICGTNSVIVVLSKRQGTPGKPLRNYPPITQILQIKRTKKSFKPEREVAITRGPLFLDDPIVICVICEISGFKSRRSGRLRGFPPSCRFRFLSVWPGPAPRVPVRGPVRQSCESARHASGPARNENRFAESPRRP